MFPRLTQFNATYSPFADAEIFSDCGLRARVLPYCEHLFRCQFATAFALPALFHHVLMVRLVVAGKQMVWIYAGWVIATVTHEQFRPCAVLEEIRNRCCLPEFAVNGKFAIAERAGRARPEPAGLGFFDEREKAFSEVFFVQVIYALSLDARATAILKWARLELPLWYGKLLAAVFAIALNAIFPQLLIQARSAAIFSAVVTYLSRGSGKGLAAGLADAWYFGYSHAVFAPIENSVVRLGWVLSALVRAVFIVALNVHFRLKKRQFQCI